MTRWRPIWNTQSKESSSEYQLGRQLSSHIAYVLVNQTISSNIPTYHLAIGLWHKITSGIAPSLCEYSCSDSPGTSNEYGECAWRQPASDSADKCKCNHKVTEHPHVDIWQRTVSLRGLSVHAQTITLWNWYLSGITPTYVKLRQSTVFGPLPLPVQPQDDWMLMCCSISQ